MSSKSILLRKPYRSISLVKRKNRLSANGCKIRIGNRIYPPNGILDEKNASAAKSSPEINAQPQGIRSQRYPKQQDSGPVQQDSGPVQQDSKSSNLESEKVLESIELIDSTSFPSSHLECTPGNKEEVKVVSNSDDLIQFDIPKHFCKLSDTSSVPDIRQATHVTALNGIEIELASTLPSRSILSILRLESKDFVMYWRNDLKPEFRVSNDNNFIYFGSGSDCINLPGLVPGSCIRSVLFGRHHILLTLNNCDYFLCTHDGHDTAIRKFFNINRQWCVSISSTNRSVSEQVIADEVTYSISSMPKYGIAPACRSTSFLRSKCINQAIDLVPVSDAKKYPKNRSSSTRSSHSTLDLFSKESAIEASNSSHKNLNAPPKVTDSISKLTTDSVSKLTTHNEVYFQTLTLLPNLVVEGTLLPSSTSLRFIEDTEYFPGPKVGQNDRPVSELNDLKIDQPNQSSCELVRFRGDIDVVSDLETHNRFKTVVETTSSLNLNASSTMNSKSFTAIVVEPESNEADNINVLQTTRPAAFTPDLKYTFSDKKCFTISFNDFKTLYNNEWINDSLIDFFIKYEIEQATYTLSGLCCQNVYAFTSFFFTKLVSRAGHVNAVNYYENIKRWLVKLDLMSFFRVIIPIHENAHWYACVIKGLPGLLEHALAKKLLEKSIGICNAGTVLNNKNEISKALEYLSPGALGRAHGEHDSFESTNKSSLYAEIFVLDSLSQKHSSISMPLKCFIIDYCKEKYDVTIKHLQFKVVNARVPKQNNFNDCGIHVIYNIRKWLHNAKECESIWRSPYLKNAFAARKIFVAEERNGMRLQLIDTLLKLHKNQFGLHSDHNNPDATNFESPQKKDENEDDVEVFEVSGPPNNRVLLASSVQPTKYTRLGFYHKTDSLTPASNTSRVPKTYPSDVANYQVEKLSNTKVESFQAKCVHMDKTTAYAKHGISHHQYFSNVPIPRRKSLTEKPTGTFDNDGDKTNSFVDTTNISLGCSGSGGLVITRCNNGVIVPNGSQGHIDTSRTLNPKVNEQYPKIKKNPNQINNVSVRNRLSLVSPPPSSMLVNQLNSWFRNKNKALSEAQMSAVYRLYLAVSNLGDDDPAVILLLDDFPREYRQVQGRNDDPARPRNEDLVITSKGSSLPANRLDNKTLQSEGYGSPNQSYDSDLLSHDYRLVITSVSAPLTSTVAQKRRRLATRS